MGAFDLVEVQGVGYRVKDRIGRVGISALFQPLVIVRAEAGQRGDLFTSKASDATSAARLESELRRGRLLTSRTQEQAKFTGR